MAVKWQVKKDKTEVLMYKNTYICTKKNKDDEE